MRIGTISLLLCLFVAVALPVRGDDGDDMQRQHRRLWKWSMVALAAGTAFDAGTSINRPEGNPMLRSANGQFGYKGLLLKSALAGGTMAFEFHFTKKHGMYKPLAIFNYVQAGVFFGAGAYNTTFFGR